jgi:hypothetical protein
MLSIYLCVYTYICDIYICYVYNMFYIRYDIYESDIYIYDICDNQLGIRVETKLIDL